MAPRWKGKDGKSKKDAEDEALRRPMSGIISQLQSSLRQSDACGFISGSGVRIAVGAEQAKLLYDACFGQSLDIADKDKQWFQLGLEESFYLSYSLKCIKIRVGDAYSQYEDLWHHMKSKRKTFPYFFKAYSHLRMKNWVVRSGAQYGVDFVIYCHHPALVHSEYGVLVLPDGDDNDQTGRLRVWSDFHCTTRLLGSVAKTLLVLYINRNGHSDVSPISLTEYTVEEQTVTRWIPEQCREG